MADKFTQEIMYSGQRGTNRLNDEFKTAQRMRWRIGNEVVPVIPFDNWSECQGRTATVNLQTGIGYWIAATDIPENEEWDIVLVVKPTTTAASQLIVTLTGVDVGITASDTTLTAVGYPITRVVLRKGDTVQMSQTSNAGDAARVISGCVRKRVFKA